MIAITRPEFAVVFMAADLGAFFEHLPHGPQYYSQTNATFAFSTYNVPIVTKDVPITPIRGVLAGTMLLIYAFLLWNEYRRPTSRYHKHFVACMISIGASCIHNIDNILRPVLYYTPEWIYRGEVLCPMDMGMPFWTCAALSGVWALRTGSKLAILLHTYLTSFGAMHYMVESMASFSPFAHASILFEVVMGILMAILFLSHRESSSSEYQTVEVAEELQTFHLEQRALRRRSK